MTRRLLVLLGVGCLGVGLWQLVAAAPSATRPLAAITWLAAVLVAHDALLAPLAVVVGFVLVRVRSRWSRAVMAVGLFVASCLALVALPAILTPGVPGNTSTTPRNYLEGLLLLLLVVAVGVAGGVMVGARQEARRRRDGPTH